jgi:hypothetical protein
VQAHNRYISESCSIFHNDLRAITNSDGRAADRRPVGLLGRHVEQVEGLCEESVQQQGAGRDSTPTRNGSKLTTSKVVDIDWPDSGNYTRVKSLSEIAGDIEKIVCSERRTASGHAPVGLGGGRLEPIDGAQMSV